MNDTNEPLSAREIFEATKESIVDQINEITFLCDHNFYANSDNINWDDVSYIRFYEELLEKLLDTARAARNVKSIRPDTEYKS